MEIIAELAGYDDMIEALRGLVARRNISYAEIDAHAQLPDGYAGKVFGPSQTKRMGWLTTWDICRVLGVRMVMIEDQKSLAAMAEAYNTRTENCARMNNLSQAPGIRVLSRVLKHIGRIGGKKRMRKMSKREMREHQHNAAMARWKQRRAKRKARAANRGRDTSPAAAPPPPGRQKRLRQSADIAVTKDLAPAQSARRRASGLAF